MAGLQRIYRSDRKPVVSTSAGGVSGTLIAVGALLALTAGIILLQVILGGTEPTVFDAASEMLVSP
jgi:hypothetical protein